MLTRGRLERTETNLFQWGSVNSHFEHSITTTTINDALVPDSFPRIFLIGVVRL